MYTPDRRGHGHTADVPGPISYDLMAADTIAFMEELKTGRAHLVGHSDGANVALLVALARPDLVDQLVLISGNFRYDGLVSGLDLGELAANEFLAEAYGEVSPDGRDHFPVVAEKIYRMASTEPTLAPADLGKVAARTLVMAGDDDMVTAEHTLELYRGIPGAELAVVPGTSHILIIEKPELCNQIILDFLTRTRCRRSCRGAHGHPYRAAAHHRRRFIRLPTGAVAAFMPRMNEGLSRACPPTPGGVSGQAPRRVSVVELERRVGGRVGLAAGDTAAGQLIGEVDPGDGHDLAGELRDGGRLDAPGVVHGLRGSRSRCGREEPDPAVAVAAVLVAQRVRVGGLAHLGPGLPL